MEKSCPLYDRDMLCGAGIIAYLAGNVFQRIVVMRQHVRYFGFFPYLYIGLQILFLFSFNFLVIHTLFHIIPPVLDLAGQLDYSSPPEETNFTFFSMPQFPGLLYLPTPLLGFDGVHIEMPMGAEQDFSNICTV
jgi:hypothetical protein